MQPLIRIRLNECSNKEKLILKEVFLRIGLPFGFTKRFDTSSINIEYGLEGSGADIYIPKRDLGWTQTPDIVKKTIQNTTILFLENKPSEMLFKNKCCQFDIVGMGEYLLYTKRELNLPTNSPVFDAACRVLANEVFKIASRLCCETKPVDYWPDGHSTAIAVTHDIDHVYLGGGLNMLYDLFWGRKNEKSFLKQLIVTGREGATFGLWAKRSMIEECVALEKKNNIRSSIFVYSGEKSLEYNPSYCLKDNFRFRQQNRALNEIMALLQTEGFEIGLHASTKSAVDGKIFKKEINRLVDTLCVDKLGVRCHRLGFRGETTKQVMENPFVFYDSSYGMNYGSGFVFGTAFPFQLDVENKKIYEIPITIQDLEIVKSINKWDLETTVLTDILEILFANNGGVFNQIWHPERFIVPSYGKRLFSFFSDFISENHSKYWFASLGEIVSQWEKREKKLFLYDDNEEICIGREN